MGVGSGMGGEWNGVVVGGMGWNGVGVGWSGEGVEWGGWWWWRRVIPNAHATALWCLKTLNSFEIGFFLTNSPV